MAPRPTARPRPLPGWVGLAAVIAALGAAAGAAFAFAGAPAKPPLFGDAVDRAVPPLPLETAAGRPTSLAAYRGRVVVLSPFLTLCHEVCPLTTSAFQMLQRDVTRAGLARRVVFAEVSVDPWRDSPRRLRAFARTTRTGFPLLTGTHVQLARFWHYFGVAYRRTKEGTPPDTDWLTGKALTFDVIHTDGLFFIDQEGRERIIDLGMPRIGSRLPPSLEVLLNAEGRAELAHARGGWTLDQALDDLGRLVGRRIARTG